MRVTQQDIARLAKVSQATVSRVLAGDERVDSEIRTRVLDAMSLHNYQPDVRARSLRQRQTHLIGLVLQREPGTLQGDPFFAMLVSELVESLVGTPWHLCVDIANSSARQAHIYDELLRTRRVDGLILVESSASDERILKLQQDNFPFVLIGNASEMPSLHCIDNDNVAAAELATQHLLDQGFRRIAFLGGPRDLTVTRDREKGYRNKVEEPLVVYSDFGYPSARDAAWDLLKGNKRPDAILAMDDNMALGALQAAREHGLSLPKDLGLVGFNDSPQCQLVDPQITSVDLQIDKMVRWSIRRLLQIVEKQNVTGKRQTLMPSELKVRASSSRQPVATVL